jgi:uncharacterized protein YuzE
MRIHGHYDPDPDIAWLRFEGHDAASVVSEEFDAGLRDIDPETGRVVGLEYWQASHTLSRAFLAILPPPNATPAA